MFARTGLAALASLLAVSSLPVLAGTSLPTGSAGGFLPYDNKQPTLTLNEVVQSWGIYPSPGGGGGADEAYLGSIRTFAWGFGTDLPAQGGIFPIPSYDALFSLTGTTYGGNGTTNFAVPDLRDRTIVGATAGSPVGTMSGNATNTLTALQMPVHSHDIPGKAYPTGPAGGGQPVDNMQPSLSMTYMIATQGVFPAREGGGSGTTFLGQVTAFTGSYIPGGYMPADGRLLSISTNPALFSILGTTYGGDGKTTFALPDLRNRTIIGAGAGPGLTNRTLGEGLGAANVSLNANQLPAHVHDLPLGAGPTLSAGGGQPFDNMQPSLALNYVIALQGIFPARDSPLDGGIYLGEVTAFAGTFAPAGWAFADGRLLKISEHAALFALLGITYGGDGRTTFALPDLRGRAIEGMGGVDPLGYRSGTETVTLSVGQMPAHYHLAAVPEPETYALMLAGLGLLGGVSRRRRRC